MYDGIKRSTIPCRGSFCPNLASKYETCYTTWSWVRTTDKRQLTAALAPFPPGDTHLYPSWHLLQILPSLSEHSSTAQYAITFACVAALAWYINTTLSADRPIQGFPIVALSEQGLNAKDSWFTKGRETIDKGLATYDRSFQVLTGTGPKIVLPNRFAEEVKERPELDFSKGIAKDFFGDCPGFGTFKVIEFICHHHTFIADVVRTKLTQSLGLVTNDLIDETTRAVHDLFGEEGEWRQEPLKLPIQRLVARLSSRVFPGEGLCRNERWLQIAIEYTVDAFIATRVLRVVPALLRPVLHWIIPQCRKLRKDVSDAQLLIGPEVEMRKNRAREALAAEKKPPKVADAIGCMYEVARERRHDVNYIDKQLGLTLAAIHTTSEALASALLDVMGHGEVLESLRREVVEVIGQHGWWKQALYKLRLMDSVLRESQRCHEMNYSMCGSHLR